MLCKPCALRRAFITRNHILVPRPCTYYSVGSKGPRVPRVPRGASVSRVLASKVQTNDPSESALRLRSADPRSALGARWPRSCHGSGRKSRSNATEPAYMYGMHAGVSCSHRPRSRGRGSAHATIIVACAGGQTYIHLMLGTQVLNIAIPSVRTRVHVTSAGPRGTSGWESCNSA